MKELVFEVTQEADGGYVAEALGESIITEADTWEELRTNVKEAVTAFYFDREAPSSLRFTSYATKCSWPDEAPPRPQRRATREGSV